MKKVLSEKKARLAVLAAFFANGAMTATWVSRIPAFKARLEMSESTLGLVLMGMSLGVLTSLFISGSLTARFGSAKVVLVCTLMLGAILPLLTFAQGKVTLTAGLFVYGAFLSTMDVAMNEQAVLVQRRMRKTIMSSFHAGYSIGGLVGALIGALITSQPHISLTAHFLGASILFCSLVIFASRCLIPADKKIRDRRVEFRLPDRALWLLGIIAFCSMAAECAMGDWSGVYLAEVLEVDSAVAALGYAAFSMAMTLGRLLGDAVTQSRTPAFVVRAGSLTAVLGLLLLALTNHTAVAIIAFALVGLGLSNIVPVAYGAAGNFPGFEAGAGIAGVATIGYTGILISPPAVGFIAQSLSLRAAMLAILLLVGTLLFSARGLDR